MTGEKIISETQLNFFLSTFHGLRDLHSSHEEVKILLKSVMRYLNTAEKVIRPQQYPFVGFIASALFGMQNMSSDDIEVRKLLSYLFKKCDKPSSTKLSPREVGMALTGLRNMNSQHDEVRLMIKKLTPHFIKSNISQRHANEQNLAWYMGSCIGFRYMYGYHNEVLYLVEAMTDKIRKSQGELSLTTVAKCLSGLQHLHHPQEQINQVFEDKREVLTLIRVLSDKIEQSQLYQNMHLEENDTSIIIGEFLSIAFMCLKNRNSETEEVRQLMNVLWSFLKRCPVGSQQNTDSQSTDRSNIAQGLTSFQFSGIISSLNMCKAEHEETLNIIESLVPHLQYLHDKNVQQAIGSIQRHFTQTQQYLGTDEVKLNDLIDVSDVFTGRHFSNVLFGLQSIDPHVVNGDPKCISLFSSLFSILTDMVQANCNSKLSEGVNRGITISIMDSNNSIWTGEDVCIAMAALRYCHIDSQIRRTGDDYLLNSGFIIDDSGSSDEELSHDDDTDDFVLTFQDGKFSLNSYAYELAGILADSLHDLRFSTQKNDHLKYLSALNEKEKYDSVGNSGDFDHNLAQDIQRVVSVAHLSRAAFGLRHLDVNAETVQRALDAIANLLHDNFINYLYKTTASIDILNDGTDNFGQFPPGLLSDTLSPSLPSPKVTFNGTLCNVDDICFLLSAVSKMTLRHNSVGRIYEEVAKLIYDPNSVESGAAAPAVGNLSFENISKIMCMLRYNLCSSEVRLVVSALTGQLSRLSVEKCERNSVTGIQLSTLMKGLTKMNSASNELTSLMKALNDHIQDHEKSHGPIEMSSGDISSCLNSMSNMSTTNPEVFRMLQFFLHRIVETPIDYMRFSVDEMYVALEGLSGLAASGRVEDDDVVDKLARILRIRT